jgi:hypothetical protein
LANFVYGDSCVSGDDKYVIAQFRSETSMGWVAELRAFLVKDELKYKYFLPERHRVQSNRQLWQRVKAGVEQAEITIVDPLEYEEMTWIDLRNRGAEFGFDFDKSDFQEMVGDWIIDDSPLSVARMSEYDWMSDNTRPGSTSEFSTQSIKRRAGGKRRDAIVTAARAHAMVSPSEKQELIRLCSGVMPPNFSERVKLIKKMARVFDVEHAKSVVVLNEFSQRVAHAAQLSRLLTDFGVAGSVQEARSEEIDHIQAADMAAGWAVDTLTLTGGDMRVLAQNFAWVSVNGILVPG